MSDWAMDEFKDMDLGDQRLDARAAIVLSALGQRPTLSIPAACGGDAETQAAYRFFDNDKVRFEPLLAPHFAATRRRIAAQPAGSTVLLVQDTTEIELARPTQPVAGAGPLDGSRVGVQAHVLQAFVPDGTPLGSVWATVINRTSVSRAPKAVKQRQRKRTPIADKESYRWIQGLDESRNAAAAAPHVRHVAIADSEADVYEWLAHGRTAVSEDGQAVELHTLVRAAQDRALADGDEHAGTLLVARVRQTPLLYEAQLRIRARQAKLGAVEDRARRSDRSGRVATVQVRASRLTLRPPQRPGRRLKPVEVNVVLVEEINPPAGEEPVRWVLLTTLPIDTIEQVGQIVAYYCVRWNIEILFRVLKSGCRIEHRRFEDVKRVLPCLGLCLVISWRTLFVCHLGRNCPELDCEAIFEPAEWKSVWAAVKRTRPPADPQQRPRLGEVVQMIAQLGGYLPRKDSPPGPQTLWIGLSRTRDLAWAWQTFGPDIPLRER